MTSITIATRTAEFAKHYDLLLAQGHVPFDAGSELCANLEEPIHLDAFREGSDAAGGGFDDLRVVPGGAIRAMGWLAIPAKDIECILLLGDENRVRGIALAGIDRSRIVKHLGIANPAFGWVGYAKVASPDEPLTAYYRRQGENGLTPIGAPRSLSDGENATIRINDTGRNSSG